MTRLALLQREHLAGVLAARGIDCRVVIVADDENLDIARGHGFDTVELSNDVGLGARFNAGFQYAAREGADYLVHIGSDDWLHPDAFNPILGERDPRVIVAGRRIAFVDLLTGKLRLSRLGGPTGVIPWIVPAGLMAHCGFAPIRPDRNRGMDGFLVRGINRGRTRARWLFHDPSPVGRVDFKSDVNINPYARLPGSLGQGPEFDPWPVLAEHYPQELVDLARVTHFDLQEERHVPKLRRPDGRVVSVSVAGASVLRARGYTDVDAPRASVAPPDRGSGPERPAKSAPKSEWVTYATAAGVKGAEDMTKAELMSTGA